MYGGVVERVPPKDVPGRWRLNEFSDYLEEKTAVQETQLVRGGRRRGSKGDFIAHLFLSWKQPNHQAHNHT